MTPTRRGALPVALGSATAAFVVLVSLHAQAPRPPAGAPRIAQALHERAARDGTIRVIVELNLTGGHIAEGHLAGDARSAQRSRIRTLQARAAARLSATNHRVIHRFDTVAYVALEVSGAALAALDAAGSDVVRVMADEIVRPVLSESAGIVEGDQAWASGYDGAGMTVAVIDTGVDASHPFLASKVVEEACYSTNHLNNTISSVCPNGLAQQIGPGSAAPCSLDDCFHGTHVAGIAAGNGATAGQPFSGVAKGAQIMAVQVFSQINDPATCGIFTPAPCLGAFTSDIIAGLERVYAVAPQQSVAAVNMSLGGETFDAPCDGEPYKPIIDNLRSIGVATVIASGNDGSTSSMSTPGCISSAVSVGSTDKADRVSWFSNVTPFLSLLAPGQAITSSVPGGFAAVSGTSMATPHVAGAWAVLKQAVPNASVASILGALRQTGRLIGDTRIGGTATIPRAQIFQALATLTSVTNPLPAVAALSPTSARAGGPAFTLTIAGSGFDAFSVVRWNGVDRPTTIASTTTIRAAIPASDLPGAGTADVTVFTPAPGGGTSAPLTFTIDPPLALLVSAPVVGPGSAETVTLVSGFGGATDWLALAPIGAPDTSYLQWTYVGSGVTTRTWTVTMPVAPGQYEFRLFLNNTSTRAATSQPVTVDASLSPAPIVKTLTPARTFGGGAAFTIAVAGSAFAQTSVVRWNGADRPTTFVSSTQLQAAIAASDIAAAGAAQVAVFTPAPGGGLSASVPFTIDQPPLIGVSATNVPAGSAVTMTLTNGIGGATDWLALAAVGAANTTYVHFVFVGSGVTSRTWTVTMPAAAGQYEFRLFLNNGYTRAATSAPVTVTPGPSPQPAISSTAPTSAIVGSGALTLTVNGASFVTSSIVRWNGADRPTTYVGGTQLRAAIGADDLAAIGIAQVSVFSPAPGGGTSSTLPFAVKPPLALAVSAGTAPAGSAVTTTLTGGPGGAGDWLALAASSAPNTSYLQFSYVGAGVTTRTWTVSMPSTPGQYEFRLFLNNGYARAATSPPVVVVPVPNPVPEIGSIAPARAVAGAAAFTLTVNGASFTASSIVRWNGTDRPTTSVSGTQLRASIPASDLIASGTAQISVFAPLPGGGTSAALPFTIDPAPALTVSASSVTGGSAVTVTLTGGFGGSTDWLALATSTASNTTYLQWTYVGANVTTRTWTVSMPAAIGTYEFRLFLNNGSARAATSPPIVVIP